MARPSKAAKKRKPAKKAKKTGRPSSFSQAVIDTICERMSKGEPLAAICRDEGMPHPTTVREWAAQRPHVSLAIAHARENGEDWLAAECLQIADTPVLGVIEKVEPVQVSPPDGDQPAVFEDRLVERKTEDMLGHRKLQIETRLKLLSKWNPKKYGDKVTLAGDADAPLRTESTVTVEPGEAYMRLLNPNA
jgi:hypothetical protein